MHASVLETSGQPCLFHQSPLCIRIARMNSQPARPPSGMVASPMRSRRTTAHSSGFPLTDSPSSGARAARARSRVSAARAIRPAPRRTCSSALNVWALVRADWASSAMSDLAAALSGAGNGAADAYWQAALRLAERSGDVVLQAAVAGEWGRHAARAGEAVTAVALLEKSAELGRRAGDDAIVAKALVNLARVELDAGRGGHAMRNIGEALARDQRGDLRAATAGLLIDVAAGAFHSGDTAHAELCLEQALSLERQRPADPRAHARRAGRARSGAQRLRGRRSLRRGPPRQRAARRRPHRRRRSAP